MEFQNSITITYRWWNNDLEQVDHNHQTALEEAAIERIIEQMKQGITSGELHDYVYMYDTDPIDGIEYNGWWDATEKKIGTNINQ